MDKNTKSSLSFISSEPSPFVINPNSPPAEHRAVFTQFRDLALDAYLQRTPYAQEVIQLLKENGAEIVNDHVALRGFSDISGGGVRMMMRRLLEAYGFKRGNEILISPLLLNCDWFEPPQDSNWPKIFVSEQQVNELPEDAQEIMLPIIGNYYSNDPLEELPLNQPAQVDPKALFTLLETSPWVFSSVQHDALLALGEKYPEYLPALQYAAWTLVHGHCWNHFTVLLNTLGLSEFKDLEALNDYLREQKFPMNSFQGKEVQGSSEKHLKQSSTLANFITHEFSDGVRKELGGSFVEFIERFFVDEEPFRGFLANNARGIFASTNR